MGSMIYKPKRKKGVVISKEQNKQLKRAVRTPNNDVIEPVIPVLDNCYNLTNEVLESVISQEITADRQKKEENHTPVNKKSLIVAGMLFLLGASKTLTVAPARLQATFYLLSLAVMVGSDPLQLFNLVLAKESRIIISFIIGMFASGFLYFWSITQYWFLAVAVALIGALLIYLLNYRWMRSENYYMDAAVEGAIINNPKSAAYQYYIYHGKTKCRTLALRQNFQFNEKILDGVFGLFYRLGYADGWEKTEQVNVTIQNLTERAEKAESRAKEAEQELKNVTAEWRNAEKQINTLKDEIYGSKSTAEYHMKLYESIRNENLRLNAEIEELETHLVTSLPVASIEEIRDVVQEVKDNGEERVRELLKQGYSIRKTVELSGVSFYNVNRIRQELKQEAEENKIVSINSATA